jgi:hypothetical protein
MQPFFPARSACRWLGVAVLGLALSAAGTSSRAADLEKIDLPSLKEIPADASYYSASLRLKEQIDIVAASKAWKKLTGLPGIQFAWTAAKLQMSKAGGPLDTYEKFVEDPENQKLVDLLGEAVSREVYFYGAANATDFTQLATELMAAVQSGPTLIRLTGNPKNLDQQQMIQASMFRVLAQNLDLIKTPDMVIGFRLDKTEEALNQLKRLEKLLEQAADKEPKLKGRVKRVKAAGGEFVTINLDGKMAPLGEKLAFLKEFEEKQGEFDAVVKKLSDLKLTVGLGVRNGYLLLTLGDSTAFLEKLGQGKRLLERPEFKALAKYADQKLTAINYLSKELHAKVVPNKRDLNNYLQLANAWLPQTELKPEQRERLKKDLATFAKEVEAYLPDPGALLSFNFLTARGTEGYAYDWGKNPIADASKPLTLLDHVGGNPLIAVVGRSRTQPGEYEKLVKWVKMAYGWAEEIALPKLEDEQRDQYKKAFKAMQPLLKRLDEVTGKMMVPALADGQGAFVLDAKLTSKQWFALMPQSDKPLPMLEPAFVVGVSDPQLLVKGLGEYRTLANEFAQELRKLKDDVPEFTIPEPQVSKIKGGTMYAYPLPQQWMLDSKLLPNGAVGEKVAVLTISEEHSARLLTATPLKTDGGPLADTKKKMSAASYVSWPGMVDFVASWFEYGLEQAPGTGAFSKEDILKQAKGVFDVLRVFKTTTSATYEEGDATVTHSETIIRDLP